MGMRGVPPGLERNLDGFLREVKSTVDKLRDQVSTLSEKTGSTTVKTGSSSGSSSGYGGGSGQVSNQTNLTLTIDQRNPNPGTTFTLTANLSGAINPTGNILFFANGIQVDGGSGIGLSNGSAALQLTETAGQYQFTALYSGDENNLGCNSNALLISVGPMGLTITETAEVFSQNGTTYSPTTITLTANQNNIGTGTVSWSVVTGAYTGSLPNGTTVTIDPTKMTTPVIVIQASCTFNGVTFTDSVSVAIAQQGSTTPLMMLSNVATTVPADASGNVESYADATTTVSVFSGPTDNTSAWTISVQSYTGCAAPKQVGTTISLDASHAMTADAASITIQAVNGSTTLTQVFSITKAKQGVQGNTGATGSNGVRGGIIVSVSVAYDGPSGSFAAAAVAQVEAISGTTPVLGDVCTDSNGNPYAYSISGGVLGWYSTSLVLNGNVVVTGTLTANKIVTNSITSLQLGNNATTNIYSGGGVVAGSNSASSTSIPASIYYIQCPPPSGGRNAGGTGKLTIIATGTLYTTNANNHAWSVAIYRTDTGATLQSSNIVALSADTGTYGQDFAITAVDTVADTATPSYTVTLANSSTAGSGTTTASFGVICFDNYK
jgi:Bacterial Ig-like domain (group 3)